MTNEIEWMLETIEPMEPLRPIEPLPPIPSEGTAMTMSEAALPAKAHYHDAEESRYLKMIGVYGKNRVARNDDRAPVAAEPVFAVDLGVINQGVDRDGDAWVRRLWYLSKPHWKDGKYYHYVYTKTQWFSDGRVRVVINPTDVHGTQAREGTELRMVWSTTNPAEVLMDRLDVGTVMSVDDAPLGVLGQIEADRQMADWREQRPGAESRPRRGQTRATQMAAFVRDDWLLMTYMAFAVALAISALVLWHSLPLIGTAIFGFVTVLLSAMETKPSSRR